MPAPQPPEVTRWCMLFIALACLTVSVGLAVTVIESERTGLARYSANPDLPDKLLVSKVHDTAQFNQAIGVATLRSLTCGAVAIAAFYFYRRLGE